MPNYINKYEIREEESLLKFPGMDHLYIRLAWAQIAAFGLGSDFPFAGQMFHFGQHDSPLPRLLHHEQPNLPALLKQAFRRTLELDPNSAPAAYNLGVVLASDRPFESLRWCKKAYPLHEDMDGP